MSLTSIAASVTTLAPPGETSNTTHSRLVVPLSTVIQPACLCMSRRGSRGTFALGLSTVIMNIRRWTYRQSATPILPRFRKCPVRALPRNLSVYIPEIAVTARLAYLQCPCGDCILDQTEWPDGIGEISDGGRRSRCRDSTACEAAEQGHPGCSKTSARSICQSCRQ